MGSNAGIYWNRSPCYQYTTGTEMIDFCPQHSCDCNTMWGLETSRPDALILSPRENKDLNLTLLSECRRSIHCSKKTLHKSPGQPGKGWTSEKKTYFVRKDVGQSTLLLFSHCGFGYGLLRFAFFVPGTRHAAPWCARHRGSVLCPGRNLKQNTLPDLPRKTEHTNRMTTDSLTHKELFWLSRFFTWEINVTPIAKALPTFDFPNSAFSMPKCGRPLSLCFFAAFIGFTLSISSRVAIQLLETWLVREPSSLEPGPAEDK